MTEKKRTVPVEDAVGHVLMHDITRIVPGEHKGPAFKKGHVIKEEDVSLLKDIGKENIYVFELSEDEYHENEAGELFKQFAGSNVKTSGPSEGKILYKAEVDGLVEISKQTVDAVNMSEDIVFTTIHSNQPVKKGEALAGIRVTPLTIDKQAVDEVIAAVSSPPVNVRSFSSKDVGLIVTGSEVASGRIEDEFGPIISRKVKAYGSEIKNKQIIGDDPDKLKLEIEKMLSTGIDFLILTGGMSVDPDDKTGAAIQEAGVEIVSSGAPVLPGNMFMVGYKGDIPVFGVPACAIFYEITVLDLFLPWVFADKEITRLDVAKKGYGGYCRHCEICTFPGCEFGKR